MSKEQVGHTVVVACRVMEPELEFVRAQNSGVEIRYIDQGLHRTPDKMAPLVQEQIDEVAPYAERVVLGYGLCSNGIVGVAARRQYLLVPRCHDCIAFFLGSLEAHKKAFEERPGTYYLTPGWIIEGKDPLSIVEDDYMGRFDRETAVWVMEEELKHYTHIVLINTGVGDLEKPRKKAMENARFFKKQYEEIQGNLGYFKKLIEGPYTDQDFFSLPPCQAVTQEMYLENG